MMNKFCQVTQIICLKRTKYFIQTTFFAAIESQLLGIVTPSDPGSVSRVGRASAATLSSSLVVHTFAGTYHLSSAVTAVTALTLLATVGETAPAVYVERSIGLGTCANSVEAPSEAG